MPYVYVLSNPSFSPDRLKIGKSIDAEERRKSLHTTGVPTPFVIEAQYEVDDHHWLEKKLHDMFKSMRVDKGREFFDGVTPAMVHEAVVDLLSEGELGADTITPYDLAESYKQKELQEQEYARQAEEERVELARIKADAEVKYRIEQEHRERRELEEAKRTKMIWCCGIALAIGLWIWNNDVKEQAEHAKELNAKELIKQEVSHIGHYATEFELGMITTYNNNNTWTTQKYTYNLATHEYVISNLGELNGVFKINNGRDDYVALMYDAKEGKVKVLDRGYDPSGLLRTYTIYIQSNQ